MSTEVLQSSDEGLKEVWTLIQEFTGPNSLPILEVYATLHI